MRPSGAGPFGAKIVATAPKPERARASDDGMSRALALALGLGLTLGCGEPLQSGGVVVRDGVRDRLGALCRWRRSDGAGAPFCAPVEVAAPARVSRLEGSGLAGPLAIGRAGDFVIENDEVVFVVDQLGAGTGFAESGGNLIDAADARSRRDELGQVFTCFGVFPRQAIYERIDAGVDAEGVAWIEVAGRELFDAALRVTTRYELGPGERALVLATQVENRGKAPAELSLGDAVQWGSARKVAPGKELGFRGASRGPFVAAIGEAASYALLPREGADVEAQSGTAWTNTKNRTVRLAPGEAARYERLFVVGARGDAAAIVTELALLGGGAPGAIDVTLLDAAGARVAAPVGARLLLEPSGAAGAVAPFLRSGPGALLGPSRLGAEVPPGRYSVSFEGGGRRSLRPLEAEVRAGEVTTATLALSEAASLRVAVREAVAGGAPRVTPAKVQLLDAVTGSRVGEPTFAARGEASIAVAPGRYRVVASRGGEFSLAEATLDAAGGAETAVDLELSRVVDTKGYIGCDLHQHTALSADAGVSTALRVVSNVVEGVECSVSSEHNFVADFAPVVRELGLGAWLRAVPGVELTSDASREPFGHANVFPLAPDPAAARGGAPAVRDRTARELFDSMRALSGERVVQINHPRSGRTGYFDQHGFDRATGVGTHPGYDPRFDALEVWSGRYVEARAGVLDDFFALLATSHPVTPTGNTDTHGVVGDEPGYPRTYVAVADDDPERLDVADLVRGVRERRDVSVTNGPFVTLRAGEVRQGAVASLRAAGAELVVAVEHAPWVDATELVVVVGGVARPPIALGAGRPTSSGAIRHEVRLAVRLGRPGQHRDHDPTRFSVASDTFVVAIVRGERPLEPVLGGDPAEIRPFAMTSPLWLDADGDGRSLGR